jgi:hypothetical protein
MDAASRLSHSPLPTRRDSGIVAIGLPVDYAQAAWDESVRQDNLKRAGQGLYELVPE